MNELKRLNCVHLMILRCDVIDGIVSIIDSILLN